MNKKRLLSWLMISILLAFQGVSTVNAYDLQYFQSNDILFSGPDTTCGGNKPITSTNTTPINDSSAKERLKTILTYFTSTKGLNLAVAAGIAANIQTETGSTFNPAIIQGMTYADPAKVDSSGNIQTETIFKPVDRQGFGLSQWTYGGTSKDRQGGLYQSALSQKKDIIDMTLQLDYIWKELTTSYKTSTFDRIQNMTDPGEVAKIYMVNYEGPADQSASAQNGRAKNGSQIYNDHKGIIADGSGASITIEESVSTETGDPCASQDNSAGGVGVADGFTFPLKTTQADIKKGADGSVWCTDNQSNCHHHYNAADIFAETGTPIIAANAGIVVSKTNDSCDYYGCNVTVMGDDDILYYYTHMSKQASVNKGQKVQAGEEIGSVGTNATAMNTPRHLHFDMLPGSKYKYRPGCSSGSCMSYPFINVQPYLTAAYKQLP